MAFSFSKLFQDDLLVVSADDAKDDEEDAGDGGGDEEDDEPGHPEPPGISFVPTERFIE